MRRFLSFVAIIVAVAASAASAQGVGPSPDSPRSSLSGVAGAPATDGPQFDLSTQPTLYLVGYAHLDTEWRWEYPQVIREFLLRTLRDNFALIDRYPHYLFNFSGANRYLMMEEYYPADFARLKAYVAAGRWFPAGSSMEESDVNVPSAESILRQILYGNEFFRGELGVASDEYMLPDCFGFPATLPSLLAHAGLKGFSTQKLVWGSAAPVGGPRSIEQTPYGIPFNVGVWRGADGKGVIAALNPGDYTGGVSSDLSRDTSWLRRVELDGKASGVYADYHYYGTGDIGGAPREPSVRAAEWSATGEGPLRVVSARADQMFRDITPSEAAGLPRYSGDLLLTNHSAGSLSSEAYQKRWNRKNELLADSAERASLAAGWATGLPYPIERLNRAWRLVMGGQFHDILPGTATPAAFEYAWNDEVLAMNQFALVLTQATDAIASAMDTRPDEPTVSSVVSSGAPPAVSSASPSAAPAAAASASGASGTPVAARDAGSPPIARATDSIGDRESAAVPLVVYNPLEIEREDVVEAAVSLPAGACSGTPPGALRISGPDGIDVPAQLDRCAEGRATVLFLARVPPVSYSVFQVRFGPARAAPAAAPSGLSPASAAAGDAAGAAAVQPPSPNDLPAEGSSLHVTASSLENARYRIRIDRNGDIASIFDKQLGRELLAAPMRLALQTERPVDWPAWNMDWADQRRPARGYVGAPARATIVEQGPVRVALAVAREAEGSRFVQTIRLAAGDAGDRIEIASSIDWRSKAAALKATFPLSASNPLATYNWDVATVHRGNNDPKKFEVPSHEWFDLTDRSGAYGVTVLTDCKYGSDKPNDNLLRLTLLYTPGLGWGNGRDYADQATQDWGHHEILYGLAAHAGSWNRAQTDWQALRLSQPLVAFQSSPHDGALGRQLSLVRLSTNRVRVLALKRAEASDEIVVRLVELDGRPHQTVRIEFAAPVVSAREVDGQERPLAPAVTIGGALVADFGPHQIRTFAVRLANVQGERAAAQPAATAQAAAPPSAPLELPYDRSVASFDGERAALGFDDAGRSLPAEMLPRVIAFGSIQFKLAPAGNGTPNALTARGQTLALPRGDYTRLYLLAASDMGDRTDSIRIGDRSEPLTVESWGGFIGQWDDRLWRAVGSGGPTGRFRSDARMEYAGLVPGFIKRAPVAWFASHRHAADGSNEPYAYSYLFAYTFELPRGAESVTLPTDPAVRVLAATLSAERGTITPAQPLYDVLDAVH